MDLMDLLLELLNLCVEGIFLLSKFPALLLADFALRFVFRFSNRFTRLIGAAVEIFGFRLLPAAFLFQSDQLPHVDLDPALQAIGFHKIDILEDVFAIKHIRSVSHRFHRNPRQFRPEAGAGSDAAMKIGEVEFLVGAMGVVIVLAPSEQQGIDSELT